MITVSATQSPPPRRAIFARAGLIPALLASLALSACSRPSQDGLVNRADEGRAIAVLAAASEHGFAPEAFPVRQLAARLKSGDDQEVAAARRELKGLLVAYGRAQHGLTIPRAEMPKAWGIERGDYDAAADLDAALAAGEFEQWLEKQPRRDQTYETLREGYLAYAKIVAAGGWREISPSAGFKPGAVGPHVEALRARLAVQDPDLALNGAFDAELAAALARFQAAHGLPPTGAMDKTTLSELNVPAATRLMQIRANLERLRWLPREAPPTRVDVNTAAATMVYFVDGAEAMSMLAAAGKPGDETPMLTSEIGSIVLNPPWNVPESIAAEELLPKGSDYLSRNGFVTEASGRLVQRPGADSALGLVKFDFDNPYAVYLHDTPAKAAFANARRAVSHGCVRLQNAVDLAKRMVANEPDWSPARVDEVLARGDTTTVKLSQKVPVRLIYLSAFPKDGRIAFRPDIYGWDAKLTAMLDRKSAKTAHADDARRTS